MVSAIPFCCIMQPVTAIIKFGFLDFKPLSIPKLPYTLSSAFSLTQQVLNIITSAFSLSSVLIYPSFSTYLKVFLNPLHSFGNPRFYENSPIAFISFVFNISFTIYSPHKFKKFDLYIILYLLIISNGILHNIK